MVIVCINCNKKFNVQSELIPTNGRKIQCGSCNHTWHYIAKDVSIKPPIIDKMKIQTSNLKDKHEIKVSNNLSNDKSSAIAIEKSDIKVIINNKTLSNFFSYLLVFIISFVALLILVDTLKSPLISIFPQLEVILFNLFETLKDVKLFITDLN